MDMVVLDTYTESSWRDTKVMETIAFSSLNIYHSFYDLLKSGYTVSAMAMIRLLVDNSMVLYAYIHHPLPDTIYKDIIEGKDLNKNNLNGKRMTAGYLATLMDEEYNGIKNLYADACSYIHPSSFLFNIVIKEFDDGSIIDNGIVENKDEEDNLSLSVVYDEDDARIHKMFADWDFANKVLYSLLEKLAERIIATKPSSSTYRLWDVSFFNRKTIMKQNAHKTIKIYKDQRWIKIN